MKIDELIINGHIIDAIRLLKDTNDKEELVLLESSYIRAKRNNFLGLLSDADMEVKINKIIYFLLRINSEKTDLIENNINLERGDKIVQKIVGTKNVVVGKGTIKIKK